MKLQLRYVEPVIISDLARKMVFLAGPRQSGKTTIAKKLLKDFRQDNGAIISRIPKGVIWSCATFAILTAGK
jgi:predicted AAA+ superfamily ATPase